MRVTVVVLVGLFLVTVPTVVPELPGRAGGCASRISSAPVPVAPTCGACGDCCVGRRTADRGHPATPPTPASATAHAPASRPAVPGSAPVGEPTVLRWARLASSSPSARGIIPLLC